jgi:peroxiredoxin
MNLGLKRIQTLIVLGALTLSASFAFADHMPFPISGKNVITGADVQVEASLEGSKPQVIVFLSQKCPCSDSHVAELKKLAQDFPEVQFTGVHSNIDESPEKTKEYFEKIALPFPIVQDDNNRIADRFSARKTPHAYVVVKNEIVYRGGVSDRKTFRPDARLYLREALEDLKQHRPLRTPEARTLGCAIPRS